nr:LysR family transcriptional regulator [Paraburkholderia sp. BCC1885]
MSELRSELRNLTFEHLLIFIAVVETGSLTRAAERLGIGKTAVSKGIQRLERVYADWSTAPLAIHALLPPGKHTSPKVRALIDMLKVHLDVA